LANLAAILAISSWQTLFLADWSAEVAAKLGMGMPLQRLPKIVFTTETQRKTQD
jgi:hypothetical protein